MKIKCDGCGGIHEVSPTGMAVIIGAFQDGDLQQMSGKHGVEPLCLGTVFTPETLAKWRRRIDTKTVIVFDRNRWGSSKAEMEAA